MKNSSSNHQKYRKPISPDFYVQGEGRFCTVYLLRPLTPAAIEWVEEHIPEDAQRLGSAVAVMHRFIADIVEGIQNDGLAVQS
jgi:hypothetical protein